MDDILKSAWGDLLNENEKLAALLDKKDARIERLEAAVDAATYYIGRLEAAQMRRVVRDMTEAMEGWHTARAALAGKEPPP